MSKAKKKNAGRVVIILVAILLVLVIAAVATAVGFLRHFHGSMNYETIQTIDESEGITMDPDVLQSILDDFNQNNPPDGEGTNSADETTGGIFNPDNSDNVDSGEPRTEPPEIIPTHPIETETQVPDTAEEQTTAEITTAPEQTTAEPAEPTAAETTNTPEPTTAEPEEPTVPEMTAAPETPEPTTAKPETPTDPETTVKPTPETTKPKPETTAKPTPVTTPEETIVIRPVDKSDKVTNILLIGEDISAGRGRTDVMMVVSINNTDKTITITSLLRDTYVVIPVNGGLEERLNAAYAIGGVALLEATIKSNFGITIDNYMKVDFDAATAVFNHLGGLDIKLDSEEIWYINRTNKPEIDRALAGTYIHLNGDQLLCHVRNRTTISAEAGRSGDWSRTYRQRTVLTAAFNKLKTMSIPDMYRMLDDIFPYVTTDISYSSFQNYILQSVSYLKYKIQTATIPYKYWYYWRTPKGQSVIRISDIAWVKSYWEQLVYGK